MEPGLLFCKSATLNVAAELPQKGLDPSGRSGGGDGLLLCKGPVLARAPTST